MVMRQTYLWLLQLAAGVFVAALLGLHMVLMHLNDILGVFGMSGADPTSFASMISRAREGAWVVIYIALLAFVLYHSLYGLCNIILEVVPSAKPERFVTWSLIALGIISFVGGSYVLLALWIK